MTKEMIDEKAYRAALYAYQETLSDCLRKAIEAYETAKIAPAAMSEPVEAIRAFLEWWDVTPCRPVGDEPRRVAEMRRIARGGA